MTGNPCFFSWNYILKYLYFQDADLMQMLYEQDADLGYNNWQQNAPLKQLKEVDNIQKVKNDLLVGLKELLLSLFWNCLI